MLTPDRLNDVSGHGISSSRERLLGTYSELLSVFWRYSQKYASSGQGRRLLGLTYLYKVCDTLGPPSTGAACTLNQHSSFAALVCVNVL